MVGLDDEGLEEQTPFELLPRLVDRVALLLYGWFWGGKVSDTVKDYKQIPGT